MLWIEYLLLAGLTLAAAVSDWRTKKIPNWFTVPMLFSGLLYHGATEGWSGLLGSCYGFGVGFGLLLIMWLLGGGGGGDVKFMGALGAWLGSARATIEVFVLSAVIVLIWCILQIIWKLAVRATSSDRPASGSSRSLMRRSIPFAIPAALSTWLWLALKLFPPVT